MKGFDSRWQDLPHYILGITREIWEQRGIATLHHYYAPDIVVRSPAGVVRGNKGVIAATMATLAEFPDRQLLGEDVIWSGDGSGNESGGYLSSHRILSTATHLNDGAYGAATGQSLVYRIIADCAARSNQIYDEWIVRDSGAIVRQMGLDPRRYAIDQIEREGGADQCPRPLDPATDIAGEYVGRGNDHPTGQRYADILTRVMGADMAVIPAEYDRAVQVELPGGVTGHGWEAVDPFWMGLRASLPSAKFEIHHQIGRDDAGLCPRAALRWSLTGTHDGWGSLGTPTGAQVHVMAISHAEFGPRGLRREFVLFDETALWKQVALRTG